MNNFTIGSKVKVVKDHVSEFPDPITTYSSKKLEFIKTDNTGRYFCKKKW